MMTYRFLQASLLLLILAAAPAWAQTPPVANAPVPGADFLRAGGGPEPDTTAPWRYYPLAVGNAWEYDRFPTGLPHIDLGTWRVDIEKDTLIDGTRYFIHRSRFYDADGLPSQSDPTRVPIRFDTLTATVQLASGRPFYETPCPLDVPFDTTVLCGELQDPYLTYGGYDEGTLSFPDTSFAVTYKGYANSLGFTTSHAAGYGRFALSFDNGDTLVLEYMRINGVEYGAPQFPLPGEPAPPEMNRLRLDAYPNPFREELTVSFEVARPEALSLTVFDARGRRVDERSLGVLASGRHEVALDGSVLAPGLYVVRLSSPDGEARTRPVVRLR